MTRCVVTCSLLVVLSSCAHTDDDVAGLRRSARSCDRSDDTHAAALYRCDLVLSRLHTRGESRDRNAWVRNADMSCDAAISAVADLEHAAAEVAFPYLPEHSQHNRIWTLRALFEHHARQLLVCGAGEALERQLDATDRYAAAAPGAFRPAYSLAAELVADLPVQATRVAATAPSIAEALRAVPPDHCPSDDAGVTRLMGSGDPIVRAFGCSCVDDLPADARAESEAARDCLADSDPWQVTEGTAVSSARSGLIGALVEVLLAPLTSAGRRNEYPVREFCRERRGGSRP